MGKIIDITEQLRNKKWPTQLEKEYVLRHIQTAELIRIINGAVGRIFEATLELPLSKRLPVFALSKFCLETLEYTKEIFSEINHSSTLSERARIKILIVEAMYEELNHMLEKLPEKIQSHGSQELT